jgi:lipoprotein-releasing system ATP-binding protein
MSRARDAAPAEASATSAAGPPSEGGLVVDRLSKHYETPRGPLPILREVSFAKAPGESLCVVGPSGSGKSTLLHVIGTLDTPSAGRVTLDGREPFRLPEPELAAFRNREVGFVFQDHFLLPQCSVLENVLAPTLVAPRGGHEARARTLLARVGLGERLDHRPAELSGGERQRAALARALVLAPRLLLCDEPTGNLDAASAAVVADLLLELHASERAILVVVTHSAALAERFADRRRLEQGRLDPL